ncbi:MAG: NFACT family protein, partial [Eubacterium sp.]|nr:NFACT family protein [Eubacterium sp.]
MALDGIFLYHLKNEILNELKGFRVDKIYQPSREELLFAFRTFSGTKKLLLSARAENARIQFTNQFVENPKKPPMLTMLLRKHLSGAKLRDIEQDGFERILTLVFDATNELGDPVVFRLIIEIMGRHSNIILVNEAGMIVECVKKIDENISSYRLVLPGIEYSLPPQQNKMNILSDDLKEIEEKINLSSLKKSKAVGEVLQGISPIVAREVENGLSLEKLREYVLNPKPFVVFLDGSPKDYTYFKPMQYGDLCEIREFETFSDLIDFFYYEQVRFERIKQRANDLFSHLTILQERAVRKAINRQNELEDCKNKEQLKIYGDLINANLYRLEKGSLF